MTIAAAAGEMGWAAKSMYSLGSCEISNKHGAAKLQPGTSDNQSIVYIYVTTVHNEYFIC